MDDICSASREEIKADYPDLKLGDCCPVCNHKVGRHSTGSVVPNAPGISREWQLLVITGASKGFGRVFAQIYAEICPTPVHFRIHGRNEEELMELKANIYAHRLGRETLVDVVMADLSLASTLESTSLALFTTTSGMDRTATASVARVYTKTIFLNNAGSLGPLCAVGAAAISPTTNTPISAVNASDMTSMMQLNVTSPCFLTSECIRLFENGSLGAKLRVVNVSSLCAVMSFATWGLYCAAKAGREMYHQVVALEQSQKSVVVSEANTIEEMQASCTAFATAGCLKVLNYAPGPIDTQMQRQIRESVTCDAGLLHFFTQAKLDNTLVAPEHSAMKLIRILTSDFFVSGEHVDYYDVIDGIADQQDVLTKAEEAKTEDASMFKEEAMEETSGAMDLSVDYTQPPPQDGTPKQDQQWTPTNCCGCAYCTCGPACECQTLKAPQCDPCIMETALKRV